MKFPERTLIGSTLVLARAAVLTVSCAVAPATAAGVGPFAALEGVWTGSGTISHQSGKTEGLRCRAQYIITNHGTNLQQALRCSTASDTFQVNSYINVKGAALSGNWMEMTRNVTGSLLGRADESKLLLTIAVGSAFSANMTMVTTGRSQSVDIKPVVIKVKNIDITDLCVELSRQSTISGARITAAPGPLAALGAAVSARQFGEGGGGQPIAGFPSNEAKLRKFTIYRNIVARSRWSNDDRRRHRMGHLTRRPGGRCRRPPLWPV